MTDTLFAVVHANDGVYVNAVGDLSITASVEEADEMLETIRNVGYDCTCKDHKIVAFRRSWV